MGETDLRSMMDDHALNRVPEEERKSWIQLSNNTMGITSTLVVSLSGALATFTAGFAIGLLTGIIAVIVGSIFGYLVGNIARNEGLSSTVITRYYGFGIKGSVVVALIFGFMILGFLSLENVLLYHGILFFLEMKPTLLNAIVIYSLLTAVWILLSLFGIRLVYRFASITLAALLVIMVYMMINALGFSGVPLGEIFFFDSQFGLSSSGMAFIAALNILIGTTGALSLVSADSCRYAKTKKDVFLTNLFGMIMMNVVMLIFGAIIAYVGMKPVVEYYVNNLGMTEEAARAVVLNDIAAFFIILAGVVGFILMLLANGKAQVLNTYSGSLALANLFSAFGLKGNRAFFVILANAIALLMISLNILGFVERYLGWLGVLTTCVATIVIVDYYYVRRITHKDVDPAMRESINWAGIATLVIASAVAFSTDFIPIDFVTSTVLSIILYPLIRLYILKPVLRPISEDIGDQYHVSGS